MAGVANQLPKLTREIVIQRSQAKFGERFTYEKFVYVNAKTPACFTCQRHGDFWTTPHIHTHGKGGCLQCATECRIKRLTRTQEEFIEEANTIHGVGRYDYTEAIYVHTDLDVKIRCPKHGLFEQPPHEHILLANGCPECAREAHIIPYEVVSQRLAEMYEDRIWIDECDYVRVAHKTKINCRYHGQFQTNVCRLLSGSDCPGCKMVRKSKVEVLWLDLLGVPRNHECRQVWLKTAGGRYRVDGFDSGTKTVYEFLGDFYHGNPKLYDPKKLNPKTGTIFGELYEHTKKRFFELESAGYEIHYVWEGDFGRQLLRIGLENIVFEGKQLTPYFARSIRANSSR